MLVESPYSQKLIWEQHLQFFFLQFPKISNTTNKIVKKTEPPVLHWLKIILAVSLIIIDEEATEKSRGKFSAFSPQTGSLFNFDTFPAGNTSYSHERYARIPIPIHCTEKRNDSD